MSRNRKPAPPSEEGAPAWMNTYGDMVTLILTFFVLLFSFSNVDKEKWKAIVQSFSGKTGQQISEPLPTLDPAFDFEDVIIPTPTPTPPAGGYVGEEQAFDKLYKEIKEHVSESGQEGSLQVAKSNGVILIRVMDTALFSSGQEQIRKEALIMLESIIDIFDQYDEAIRMIHIEGHTDNVPIKSARFDSNWELSTSRAVNVVKYCIENSHLSPMKYAASGYGEYHPIADNTTEEGKAKNRRVDFLVMSTESIALDGNNSYTGDTELFYE